MSCSTQAISNQVALAPLSARTVAAQPADRNSSRKPVKPRSATVFDRLYREYLPFRLYADHTMGASFASLAKEFGVAEHWVAERVEAVRLCLGKQVHVNLGATV